MAKPGKTSPLPESRASSFTRKRTCSHLESSSPRMRAQKHSLVTSGNEEPTSDYMNSEDLPEAENVAESEGEDEDWARLGSGSSEPHRDNRDWNNQLALHQAEKGKEEVYLQECGIEAFHGTSVNGPPNSHRAVCDGMAMANDISSLSDSCTDVAYELGETLQAPAKESKVTSSSTLQKPRRELRRVRKTAQKEMKRLRAENQLQKGKIQKPNNSIHLAEGGNGFMGLEYDNGGESCKEQSDETSESEEAEDSGDNLIIGSSGVPLSPVLSSSTSTPKLGSIPDSFIDVSTDSNSSITDKDLYTRRIKAGKTAKSMNPIPQKKNIASSHSIIEISSDDETFNAASATVSSLESGEEISTIEPLTAFPPPIPEKALPRVCLLMQYYTPLSKSAFSPEESIYPINADNLRIPSPKRRRTEGDLSLQEFFQRQICGVCASEGHEERKCEKLRCRYCLAWDKHFSHACPHKPPRSAGSSASEEGAFDWRHVPPASIPKTAKKAHPDQLNIACYACASENHFGDDCPSNWRTQEKGPWSMKYAESRGWAVDSISGLPGEKTGRGEGGRERAVALNRAVRNSNSKHDREHTDHYRNRDHDHNHRDRDWNRDKHRGGGVVTHTSGRQLRSRSPHRSGGVVARASGRRLRSRSPLRSGGYGRNRSRDRSRDRRMDSRRRSPPPPPPPTSMLPPLPPQVGYTRAGGRRGAGNNRAGRGRGLAERIRMPSSGRKEWRG